MSEEAGSGDCEHDEAPGSQAPVDDHPGGSFRLREGGLGPAALGELGRSRPEEGPSSAGTVTGPGPGRDVYRPDPARGLDRDAAARRVREDPAVRPREAPSRRRGSIHRARNVELLGMRAGTLVAVAAAGVLAPLAGATALRLWRGPSTRRR